ncbi:hypothetical protein SLITO_v1c04160 [Spiroplasma litorale]|uniref:Uncharacterized protein n=1 Tax=Spiroplasma litorale TaxID=216942 RepID=A0A0K1W167_9MOLU|nr:hypothetical protein [Spiroplasma litorale]AKX34069.1 hypothetical protein SLITO_v1c04160 [Spiroplasma litorale]
MKFKNFYVLGNSLSDAGGYKSIAQVILNKTKNKIKYEFGGNFEISNNYPSYSNRTSAVEWVNYYLGFDSPMKPGGAMFLNEDNINGRNYAIGGARSHRDISISFNEINIIDKKMSADLNSQTDSLIE